PSFLTFITRSPHTCSSSLSLHDALPISLLALGSGARAAEPATNFPVEMTARPPLHVRPAFTSSPIGYSPAQIRHAYGFDQLSKTDRKSTRLNSSHEWISYAVFCLKKKKK